MKKRIPIPRVRMNEAKEKAHTPHIITEGVHYDKETNAFTFDFEHDNETDIIKLEQIGYSIEAFERCYHYGYEFAKDVDSSVRTQFIKHIKFPESFDSDEDLKMFIRRAVGYLDSKITLPKYNVVVIPESMSELNRKMLTHLSRITTTEYIKMELVKELPSKIEFDYKRFTEEVLNSTIDGKPRYTQRQKEEVISRIESIMDDIHKKQYFSIARDIKKSKYRQYIKNYYRFKDNESKELYTSLSNTNVILLDDIVTSGTTIYHMLETLRCVNETNNIVVFSLIGRKDI